MIVLADTSALEFLRHRSEGLGLRSFSGEDTRPHRLPLARGIKAAACEPSHKEALSLIDRHPYLSLPLHVLAPSAGSRPNSKLLRSHCWSGEWSPSAFVRTDGVIALRPEVCFVRMARHLSWIKVMELGYELCGCYAKSVEGKGFLQRPPLMTVDSLERFANKPLLRGGVKAAQFCAQHILPRSGSPMETALAMLLFLPKRHGGYGLPRAELNFALTARMHSGRMQALYCDAMWPQKRLALEYDSNQWHSGSARIARDSSKRALLLEQGIDVISVTWGQVANEEKLDTVVRAISRKLGWRLQGLTPEWRKRQRALKHVLLFEDE